MLAELAERPELDAARTIYYGRSLGGGVVCSLLAERPPSGLILQSTFASLSRMLRGYLIPGWLVRDPFDNAGALRAFDGPVLIMHGTRDTIIPHAHTETLVDAAAHAELHSFPCGHNDFPTGSREHLQLVDKLLGRAFAPH